MSAAVSKKSEPETVQVFVGDLRKYGLDEDTALWKRLFFKAVYLPFVRFSFKYVHIPAMGSIDCDGQMSWVETIIVTTDEDRANRASKDEFYCVRRYQMDKQIPEASLQCMGHHYPNSIIPDRYRRRVFPLTTKSMAEVIAEQKAIDTVSKRIDQLAARIRTTSHVT